MHPRNKYAKQPADFGELARFRPSLKPYLIDKRCGCKTSSEEDSPSQNSKTKLPYTLNFCDSAALRELTCAVLERDFGLKLDIPMGFLIPTVPQKLNYIHWIEDLLIEGVVYGETVVYSEDLIPKGKSVMGIDIGTGMSCIYPLLGCKLNGWNFIATDVTMETVQCAVNNVLINDLQDRIQVKLVPKDTILEEALDPNMSNYSFTMCNPPFFKSKEDMLGAAGCHSRQRPLPHTFSSGTDTETLTEGGEVGFVKRLIHDSLRLKNKVQWYTSMLGKKASLKELVSVLKSHNVPVVTTTEFVQGKTWRWGIAWSFDPALKDKVKDIQTTSRKRQKSSGDVLQLVVRGEENSEPPQSPEGVQEVKKWLDKQFKQLQIDCVLLETGASDDSLKLEQQSTEDVARTCEYRSVSWKCTAHKVTWAHPRKKRRLLEKLSVQKLSSEDLQLMMDNKGEASPKEGGTRKNLSSEELQEQIKMDLEALCPPCDLHFMCSVTLTAPGETAGQGGCSKRRKKGRSVSGEGGEERDVVCVELQWVKGNTDRDQLHQIMQYLRNKMNMATFKNRLHEP